ncbi:BAT38-like protein [Mya arenaria]|uniref:BAT38-like protein n=1 Tax=Mya arenaria TaxID=6604 RepID=A0ABY7GBC8_MYAAR|nr:BAT38-like protein [Mya arenaria]
MENVDNSDGEATDTLDIKCGSSKEDQALQKTTSVLDVSMYGESKGLADVTLVVEDRRIPVTKAVLELASPVFLTMFQSDFQGKEKSEITLPGKRLSAFAQFLKCIYSNIFQKVTVENVYDVVYLANEYQVEHLKPLVNSEVYHHLVIAEACQLDELQARCIGIATGVTKVDREAAAKIHPISKKVEVIIDKQAIRKLEINTSDLRKLIRVVGGDNLQALDCFETFSRPIASSLFTASPPVSSACGFIQATTASCQATPVVTSLSVFGFDSTPLANNLQKLRLLYQYAPESEEVKKDAIQKVRNDKLKKEWKTTSGEEFDLLPEKIKHDIRGRQVMKY